MLEKRDDKYYIDDSEVMDGINSVGWWDGPIRYKKVNRNIISWVQHDVLFNIISKLSRSICGISIGIDIGGLGEKPISNIISINIYISELCKKDYYILGRGEMLPLKDGSIDYIISCHTLEHIKNTENVLREWIRVLKVGALLAIVLPDKRYFLHNPNVIKDEDIAYSEMEPGELFGIIKRFDNIEIISFNTFDNNFDFECIIRKIR